MRFTRLVNKSSPTLSKIYAHPFNQQLYNGTLSAKAFRFFIEQDELYLRDYSLALKTTSTRLKNKVHAEQFKLFSEDIVKTERKLLLKYLNEQPSFAFFNQSKTLRKKIPVISDYTEYLLHQAENATIEEAVASLIACPGIYEKLGMHMPLSACESTNPYRDWIASYSSPRFISSTHTIIEIADELNKVIACPRQQERVHLSFQRSAEFELQFFDEAFMSESQPYKEMESLAI